MHDGQAGPVYQHRLARSTLANRPFSVMLIV
jgi:hypothetical protein